MLSPNLSWQGSPNSLERSLRPPQVSCWGLGVHLLWEAGMWQLRNGRAGPQPTPHNHDLSYYEDADIRVLQSDGRSEDTSETPGQGNCTVSGWR